MFIILSVGEQGQRETNWQREVQRGGAKERERKGSVGRNFNFFWHNLQGIDKPLHSGHPDPQTAVLSCCTYCMVIPHCDLQDGASLFVCSLVWLKFDSVSERVPYTAFLGNDGLHDVSCLSTNANWIRKSGKLCELLTCECVWVCEAKIYSVFPLSSLIFTSTCHTCRIILFRPVLKKNPTICDPHLNKCIVRKINTLDFYQCNSFMVIYCKIWMGITN